VSGVFVRVTRRNASSGNFIVSLESGPASDSSGNGTLMEQVTVPAAHVFDVGSFEDLDGTTGGSAGIDLVPYLWVPFTQNHTLTLGQFYSLRFSATGNFDMWVGGRSDSFLGMGPNGRTLTQDQWEAQRQIEWTAWEDSRGMMLSSNGGTTWFFGTQRLTPAIFKCVL
jgi:hypothetical protein